MKALHLDAQLCFSLYAASRAMTAAYGPLLGPLGLTYPQYLVMLVLWEGDGLSVKALGERLQLDSGTLTPLLKKLERAGQVVRARDDRDARVVRVSLTAAGKALRKKAQAVPRALLCLTGLDLPGLARLREELLALTLTLREATAQGPTDEGTNP
jgi:MarR family transcriptional regulator, organic hydroperoxide resistance regulator